MHSGAAEVAGTARTFLPKRAIHGTTEEARLNSVRGFLCDGNACRHILHKAISSSAMSGLDLLTERLGEEAEDAATTSRPTRHHQRRRCAYTHPQPGFRQ
jgi:hypothetical protein